MQYNLRNHFFYELVVLWPETYMNLLWLGLWLNIYSANSVLNNLNSDKRNARSVFTLSIYNMPSNIRRNVLTDSDRKVQNPCTGLQRNIYRTWIPRSRGSVMRGRRKSSKSL